MKNWLTRKNGARAEKSRAEPTVRERREPRLNLKAFRHYAEDKRRQASSHGFMPYEPPKGVVGDQSRGMATDEALCSSSADMASLSPGYNQIAMEYYEDGLAFLGYPQLAQMLQRAEFRKPCQTIARECTREWIEFKSEQQGGDTRDNDAASKQIREVTREFTRLNVRHVIQKQIFQSLAFGLGHVWIGMKGTALNSAGQSDPLVIGSNGMSKGSLERLVNIEPIWTTPNKYSSSNVLERDFYKADSWWALGTEIHHSRLLTAIPFPVSQILAPAFNFGGQSLTQQLMPYVHNYLGTRNSVSRIVRNSSYLTLGTDMTGNMQADMPGQPMPYGDVDMQSIQGRAAYMQDVSSGQSTIVFDKERESVAVEAVPLSGLDALQAQAMEAQAAIPGIPLVKMFGLQPQGLNASSEGEIRVFYDEISSYQEEHVRPILQRIFEAVQINLWGKIDPDLSFVFVPLWQMDAKQMAEIEKIKADTDALNVQEGKITADEAREREASDPNSIYKGVNLRGPAPGIPAFSDGPDVETLMQSEE